MKNSERSDQRYKAKFVRLKRLFQRREVPREQPTHDWWSSADEEGNVTIHPNHPRSAREATT